MRFNSIRFKISILYVLILGIILSVYSGILYLSLRYTLYEQLDKTLDLKAKAVTSTINTYFDIFGHKPQSFLVAVNRVINLEGKVPGQNNIQHIESEWLKNVDKLDLKEDYINFLSLERKPIISSRNFPAGLLEVFSSAEPLPEKEPEFSNIEFNGIHVRVMSVPFYYEGRKQYVLQIGTSTRPIIDILRSRVLFNSVSIPVILLLTSFLGRFFTKRILRPVLEITRMARQTTHEDLSRRVKAGHIDEEMRYLVDAFNGMISRLEQSFMHIADFSSHVAHELKTPLTIIRGESEIALMKERSSEEYRRAIEVSLEEVTRMLKIIEDLLLLTRIEYQPEIFKFEHFDLRNFLEEVYAQTVVLARKKNIATNIYLLPGATIIKADRLHLRRLFLNLIHNAIKFTPENGRISIEARCGKDANVEISVSDTGVGISEKDLPKIFDRFYHTESSSIDAEPGSGLGLSIAHSIAQVHNGSIQVKSHVGSGTCFTVTLPVASS